MPLPFDLPGGLLTLALGAVGGGVASALGLPLALLLGSLVSVATAAILDLRPFGRTIGVPQKLRFYFVPVIGVSIGGSFTPQVLAEMPGWWPSLLGLVLYIPLVHWLGYRIYTRLGDVPPVTAFFGAVPGGLIESVAMGEEKGADVPMLVLLQFLRLILTIIAVPLIFLWLTGHAVGSASGVAFAGADAPLAAWDVLVLLAAGVIGFALGRRLHFPAAIMTGPVIASSLAHLTGLTQAVPPDWAVAVTQVVVGTVLGARFSGMPKGTLTRALRLSLINGVVALALAFGFALAFAPLVGEPVAAAFLAFAPGGVAEMSLIALSLQMSVVYVTAHHIARIMLSVTVARLFSGRLDKG